MRARHQLQQALSVLRKEGPRSLAIKGSNRVRRDLWDRVFSLPLVDDRCRTKSLDELAALQAQEETARDVIQTTDTYRGWGCYRDISLGYNHDELAAVVDRVRATDPANVLEIGTGRGGSAYVWTRALEPQRFASIDIGYGYHPSKLALFETYSKDVDLTFLRRNSQTAATRRRVASVFDESPIDFLFIDGDHTYDGVSRDWELYRDLLAEDAVVAFHDIVEKPNPRMGVPTFWREVRDEFRSEEIIVPPDSAAGGTGLLYLGAEHSTSQETP